jgi:hypothetical protein
MVLPDSARTLQSASYSKIRALLEASESSDVPRAGRMEFGSKSAVNVTLRHDSDGAREKGTSGLFLSIPIPKAFVWCFHWGLAVSVTLSHSHLTKGADTRSRAEDKRELEFGGKESRERRSVGRRALLRCALATLPAAAGLAWSPGCSDASDAQTEPQPQNPQEALHALKRWESPLGDRAAEDPHNGLGICGHSAGNACCCFDYGRAARRSPR